MQSLKIYQDKLPVSVVIATLGGEVLLETLKVICSMNPKPMEVLVCMPGYKSGLTGIMDSDVSIKVIPTGVIGQVSQRAVGLSCVTQPYVLQMDDDIILQPTCLSLLFAAINKLGPGNVVAPNCYSMVGEPATNFSVGPQSFLHNLYQTLVYGAPWGLSKQGKLIKSGVGYWVDVKRLGQDPFLVDWVPGGCVLSAKEDLILDTYYPFSGKAYAEDLIHSVLWRNAGKKMWAIPLAGYSTKIEPFKFSIKEIYRNFQAHYYLVKMINGSIFRLYLWYFIFVVKNLVLIFFRCLAMVIKR